MQLLFALLLGLRCVHNTFPLIGHALDDRPEHRGAPQEVQIVRSIRHRPVRFQTRLRAVQRRRSCGQRERVDADPVAIHERVGVTDNNRFSAALAGRKDERDILGSTDFRYGSRQAKRGPRSHDL